MEEIVNFAEKDIDAIAGLLGDQKFMFGDKPSRLGKRSHSHRSELDS